MILIDFDRTIFDSDGYYDSIRRSLQASVSVERWHEMYREYQQEHRVMNIFSLLKINNLIQDSDLTTFERDVAKSAPEYVYPDARRLLDNLTASGVSYVIFSFGEKEFQKYKIIHSKVPTRKIVITGKPKYQHNITRKARVWIDDNPHEFIHDASDSPAHILLCRKGSKYNQSLRIKDNWSTIESLEELAVDKDGNVRIIR